MTKNLHSQAVVFLLCATVVVLMCNKQLVLWFYITLGFIRTLASKSFTMPLLNSQCRTGSALRFFTDSHKNVTGQNVLFLNTHFNINMRIYKDNKNRKSCINSTSIAFLELVQ